MTTQNEELLSAESAVQSLLNELVELKRQIGGYANASKNLNDVAIRLDQLIVRTHELSLKSHEGILVLKEMGGPEILSQLELIEEILDGLKIIINQIDISQKIFINKQTQITSLVKINIAFSVSCLLISTVTVLGMFLK
jgi:hypothetical protein